MIIKFVKDEEELRSLLFNINLMKYKLVKVERLAPEKLKVEFERADGKGMESRILRKLKFKKELMEKFEDDMLRAKMHITRIKEDIQGLRDRLGKLK